MLDALLFVLACTPIAASLASIAYGVYVLAAE